MTPRAEFSDNMPSGRRPDRSVDWAATFAVLTISPAPTRLAFKADDGNGVSSRSPAVQIVQ